MNFDFLGKDSMQYKNTVAVEKRVFKNLARFKENKKVTPLSSLGHTGWG